MSSLYNLFELAKSNEPALKKRFETVKKAEEDKGINVDAICAYLDEHLNFSINFDAEGLQDFVKDKIYKSDYERFPEDMQGSEHPKGRIKQRLELDSRFENSVDFKYAALNCGNRGLSFWGDYCLIFDLKEYEKVNDEIVFLQRNSLQKTDKGYYYFDDEIVLKFGKLLQEMGTSTTKNELICIKLAGKMSQVGNLPDVLCDFLVDEPEYVEMIFTNGAIIPYLLKAVIIRDKLQEAIEDAIMDGKPSDEIREMQEQHSDIQEFLEAQNIELEYLEEDM